MSRTFSHDEAGFTLVEMLVAMFIFSIISVGSMSALTSSIQSKERIEAKLDTLKSIELSRAIISEDIANIVLRDNRDILGGKETMLLSGGLDNLLSFTRSGRQNPGGVEPRGDIERAAYIFENGTLIRRAFAHENPSQSTPVVSVVLLEGLANAYIEFIETTQTTSVLQVESSYAVDSLAYTLKLTLEFDAGQTLVQYFELDV